MDQILVELVGKLQVNPPKIITVVAENFALCEDHATFLKATLAIPTVKQLPLDNFTKRLIQFGPIHRDVAEQLKKTDWLIHRYDDLDDLSNAIESMDADISATDQRSFIVINDSSRLSILFAQSTPFFKLLNKWKRKCGNYVVVLNQNSQLGQPSGTFLRDLEYLSDACVRIRIHRNCYLHSIWFETIPTNKTLMSPKIATRYYSCKIGKVQDSSELLCFHDHQRISKDYDPKAVVVVEGEESAGDDVVTSKDDEEKEQNVPYSRARNPEQSKIFFYPEKEDDCDEEDPDDDLPF